MSKWLIFLLGIVLGWAALATWRYVHYHTTAVHYHANFAVYLNGSREPFSADSYYEGITNCYADESNEPTERAHMHDHVNDLIHVHAKAVTWGDFFQNLGWGIGQNYVQTRDRLYVADASHRLTYLLNGQPVDNPAGLVIKSLDKLLVSYGTTDKAKVQSQFKSISNSAEQANSSSDPASCGGSAPTDWRSRLNYIFQ